jgi:hypothetical protein
MVGAGGHMEICCKKSWMLPLLCEYTFLLINFTVNNQEKCQKIQLATAITQEISPICHAN